MWKLGLTATLLATILPCMGDGSQIQPDAKGQAPRTVAQNVALGKSYMLYPAPNYSYCKDQGDSIQLTDGKKYEGPLPPWRQASSVGWMNVSHAMVTIDLGKICPISGVSVHTFFDGRINVPWPSSILVFTSDDNREFHYVCDLVNPQWPDLLPPDVSPIERQRLTFYNYANGRLEAKGRFIAFAIKSERYMFCDEIEVFKGSDGLLEKRQEGASIGDLKRYVEKMVSRWPVQVALSDELKSVRWNALRLKAGAQIDGKLSKLDEEVAAFPGEGTPLGSYRAVAPLNEVHKHILQTNGEIMRAAGISGVKAWSTNRWEPLKASAIPPCDARRSLAFALMRGERRAEALNLTNAEAGDIDAGISLLGLPEGVEVKISQVEFVGAKGGKVVADALVPVEMDGSSGVVKVPSGMTRQIWLDCFSGAAAPGTYKAELKIVAGGGRPEIIPVSIRIYPQTFPKAPTLSLFTFDYTDKPYAFKGMTGRNVALAIEDMRTHYVNTAYGHRGSACWPDKADFDKEGNLVVPLRAAGFDEWVKQHEGYKNFHLYLGEDLQEFAGEPVGSKRFERMVGQWITKFADHARGKGIDAGRIAIHLMDEPPRSEWSFRTNTCYGNIIRAAVPEIKLFTDAFAYETAPKELLDMLASHNAVCPSLPDYFAKMRTVKHVIGSAAKGKRDLWLYSCIGPGQLMDPYFYYRVSAWQCLVNNAIGEGFWCYWNYFTGDGANDWNGMLSGQTSFGLVYKTDDAIISSKRWEAVREGVEDYEYFVILKDRIDQLKGKGLKSDLVRQADVLCVALPEDVVIGYEGVRANDAFVEGRGNRTAADAARMKVLEMLCKLDELDRRPE